MAKKEKTMISLQTVTNGYTLNVDGNEFMYYTEIDLLAGFLAHVGIGETTPMEKGTILSSLFSAMLGGAYADAVTTLKQRVALLTSQYTTTIDRMDKAIDYVTQAEKQIDGMTNRIKALEDSLKATDMTNATTKKTVNEANARMTMIIGKVSDIEKRAEKVYDKLTDILTTKQTIENLKKEQATEEGVEPSKSKSKSEKPDDDGKKIRKSRKERDQEILEKAKGNKDIK